MQKNKIAVLEHFPRSVYIGSGKMEVKNTKDLEDQK